MSYAQLFSPAADFAVRAALALVVVGLGATVYAAYVSNASAATTGQGRFVEQPIPFSHAHHVGGLGIDCRYCHEYAWRSSHAGLPSSDTCMHCHKEIWTDAPMLEPVRESWRTGQPLMWRRVYELPEHVYFDHAAHVNGGVGCESCHGRVDRMPLMAQAASLQMQWCLDCHRDPGPNLRPPEAITALGWSRGGEPTAQPEALQALYQTPPSGYLTDCSACHR